MIPRPKEGDAVAPIVHYIEKNLAKGHKLESLKWALINQKYSKIEIDKAIKIIEARTPKKEEPKVVPMEEVKQEPIVIPEKKGFFARLFGRD
jgi:hypothetical protein